MCAPPPTNIGMEPVAKIRNDGIHIVPPKISNTNKINISCVNSVSMSNHCYNVRIRLANDYL